MASFRTSPFLPGFAKLLFSKRVGFAGRVNTESPGKRLPALVWKIHLLHGAQTRLVQNAAIAGDAPGTLSRLGTERIQGQCAALLKITQEIQLACKPAMVVNAGNQAAAAPASCCAYKDGYGDR